MSIFTPPQTNSVATWVSAARIATDGQQLVAQVDCVDWLLDCLNACVRPSVGAIIEQHLTAIAHITVVRAADFVRALDEIQLALQVDAAFDHLELGA